MKRGTCKKKYVRGLLHQITIKREKERAEKEGPKLPNNKKKPGKGGRSCRNLTFGERTKGKWGKIG